MVEIRAVDGSPGRLGEVAAFLRGTWPRTTRLTPAYLDWLYNRAPDGAALANNLYRDGRLVAHLAALPIRALYHGRETRGVLTVNIASHPDIRGTGLFTRLATESYERAAATGYAFHIAIPNAQSTPLYTGRLGNQLLGPLDVKLGVGPVAPRREVEGLQFARLWTPEALAWRLAPPNRPYRVQYRNGCGCLYAATGRFGIYVEVGSFARELLPAGLPELAAPHPVRLWIGADRSRDWSRSAYVDIPLRLRPSPLNFICRDLTGKGRLLDPARVRLDVLDFDAY